jgi:hypothetical protein
MKSKSGIIALLLFACLALPVPSLPAQPAEEADPNEPPIAGQPELFNGAVGLFHVSMHVQPTHVQAENPLTLTVRITADATPVKPPKRLDLRRRPRFVERFHIERSAGDQPDRTLPNEHSWEFDYRLRPKSQAVTAVPNLRFDYFKPGYLPATKGYQTAWAYAIPLEVGPPELLPLSTVVEGERAPESVPQIVTGPAVLRREAAGSIPGPWQLAGLVLAVPAGCAVWYAAWRRCYPDAARQVWQRRTRAARKALHALRNLRAPCSDGTARQVTAILTHYLQQRLNLRTAELTPAEVAERLQRSGCPTEVTERAAALLRARDAARFSLDLPSSHANWPNAVTQLILALEGESW